MWHSAVLGEGQGCAVATPALKRRQILEKLQMFMESHGANFYCSAKYDYNGHFGCVHFQFHLRDLDNCVKLVFFKTCLVVESSHVACSTFYVI